MPIVAKPKLSNTEWSVSEVDFDNSDEAQSFEGSNAEHDYQQDLDLVTRDWASTCAKPPTVELRGIRMRDLGSDQCDFDTFKGTMLPPVAYPETYKEQSYEPSHDIKDDNWRRDNMTSELWITKEVRKRKALADKIRSQVHEAGLQLVPVKEEPWPVADCLLRPATPADFEGIAAVMNEERTQDQPNVLEPAVVGPAHVRTIYDNCQRGLRPFIVAVPAENQFFDRSKWPEGADKEFEEFVRFKKSQQKSADANAILGFAFVNNARNGIFGTPCYGSRFSGRITLLVHPNHRQKSYGTALLDRVLLSVAAYHRSVIDYKWECANPSKIYEQSVIQNSRKYSRLYIETLTGGAEDSRNGCVNKLLDKFGFEQVGRLNQAVQSKAQGTTTWLDVNFWEFQARPAEEITE